MKYEPGGYIVYIYDEIGSNLKHLTFNSTSVMLGEATARALLKKNEFADSYVVLRVIRNSKASTFKGYVKHDYVSQA